MGMCKCFLKDATKIQNGCQRSISYVCGRKKAKISGQKVSKKLNHLPNNFEMCKRVFKDATNIQNGRYGPTSYFCGRKNLKSEIIQFL